MTETELAAIESVAIKAGKSMQSPRMATCVLLAGTVIDLVAEVRRLNRGIDHLRECYTCSCDEAYTANPLIATVRAASTAKEREETNKYYEREFNENNT